MIKNLIALASFLFISTSAFAAPLIGSPAPDFKVTSVQGVEESLAQHKGKFIVLEWNNPGCPFVKKHYSVSNMQNLQKEFIAKGVVWMTINSSAAGKEGSLNNDEAKNFIKENNWSGSGLILDGSGTIGKLYGARTTPQMFVIDPKGNLIYSGAIDSNSSAKSDSIKSAQNYVKLALEEALAGKPVTTASTEPYGCSVKYAG